MKRKLLNFKNIGYSFVNIIWSVLLTRCALVKVQMSPEFVA